MKRIARILYIAKNIMAGDTITEHPNIPMIGKLVAEKGEYVLLKAPSDFTNRIYDAIYEEGMKKPPYGAHISVMTDEEHKQVGPIKEDGQEFEYNISSIESCNPEGWDEMEKVWFVKCKSSQLENLRKKYGLEPLMFGGHDFHITVAVREKKEK
jgi:hypothetical protein